ncbi:MAG: nickel pincer cofactor biosynthesis protein LarB [Actinomycetia bacterium]|nr:nickel pincer cofactor biosynthesis protein LarB [Actinomycetes bacterium]
MNQQINNILEKLLEEYRSGQLDKGEALSRIKDIYFEDLGFAKIDHHRSIRRDFPEVIFGQNKTDEQLLKIAEKINKYSGLLLVTRTSHRAYLKLKQKMPDISFNPEAKIIYTPVADGQELCSGITVVCAGTSDIPVAEEAAITAYLMGNKVEKIYDVGIAGMHRLLNYRQQLQDSRVIVCVAGMEGALPGVIGAMVSCPVIGVPTSVGYGASLGGISALLTMLNSCSPGVVVTNIDNGFGAGYTAGIINKKHCRES